MFIKRQVQQLIKSYLEKDKIIILYWARQVGKTTLAKKIFEWKDYLYINWDELENRIMFSKISKIDIEHIIWNWKYIIFDEAQRIKNIWIILKIIHDNFPQKKIIATWSSSFDLANTVNEPLTGRKLEFQLFPFWIKEINHHINQLEISSKIEQYMITWLYPNIILDYDEKSLKDLANNYVYKDILTFDKIKKSDAIVKLLQSIALQIWNEVSYNELWEQCNLNPKTVEQYIQILEQAFIIFRLQPYTTNQRTWIKKLKKIYFWDLWIRNAIINNINPVWLRNDIWWIRENFAIVEILKDRINKWEINNYYFRRDGGSEIDLLINKNWKLHWFEMKYTKNKWKNFNFIKQKLELETFDIVNKDNILNYI